MPTYPAYRLKPYYDALKTWLLESHNEDGTLKSSAVQTEVSAAIANNQTVVDAAAAAVDANPTIADHETRITAARSDIDQIKSRTFDPTDYEADKVGTDWVPAFRAMQADVKANGGGTIILPGPYDYTFESVTNTGGTQWQWVVDSDNTEIIFDKGARIVSTVDHSRPLMFYGSAKPAGMASWASYTTTGATVYTLTGSYAKGAGTLTLATPADATNFAAGDYIFIRTGQTLAGSGQPDSEINMVTAADSGTGVLTLAWPTAKPYAQEYYITGTSGFTSTAVTANPAPFGVAKVTDRILTNIGVKDMQIVTQGLAFQGFSLWGVVGTQVRGGTLEYQRSAFGSRDSRGVIVSDLELAHTGTDDDEYGFHPSTGCSNWLVNNLSIESESWTSLQCHEGVAASSFKNFRVRCAAAPVAGSTLAVRARGYDLDFDGFEVTTRYSGSSGNSVYVENTATGGGRFANGTVTGGTVRVDAPNWRGVETLRVSGGDTAMRGSQVGYGHQVQPMIMTGVVRFGQQTITLGTLPRYAVVTKVECYVATAFNSDGTDEITVGTSSVPTRYATAIDVSATGVKTVTSGSQVGIPNSGEATVQAVYTNGGSEPTTGVAHITVHYYLGARPD